MFLGLFIYKVSTNVFILLFYSRFVSFFWFISFWLLFGGVLNSTFFQGF